MVSQAQNLLNLDLSNQFSFSDFESSSKDWVLTFLNKTIIVDEKVIIIDGFSNLFTNDIEKILETN
jgi:archaellum biogenesis ATPase FlaH